MANTLNYGSFLSAVINFLILALVVFWLVKFLNKLMEMGHKKGRSACPSPRSLLMKKSSWRRSGIF